jgi:hypothetical protein
MVVTIQHTMIVRWIMQYEEYILWMFSLFVPLLKFLVVAGGFLYA